MRVEYNFSLDQIETPRFSVEAVEGIAKVFTLATLVLNVLESRTKVELVFHGLNPDDPARKIDAFKRIIETADSKPELSYSDGNGGTVPGSSSYFRWVTVSRP